MYLSIAIAGVKINIHFKLDNEFPQLAGFFKKRIQKLLVDFIIPDDKKPAFTISIIYKSSFKTLMNTDTKTYMIGFYEELPLGNFVTYYHISNEQFLIIIRNIVHMAISGEGGLIIHGASSMLNSEGILFLGDSGAGKSTIVSLLQPEYKALADDIFILKKERGKFFIYQTPFIQKRIFPKQSSGKFPLKKIFFLQKGVIERKVRVKDPGRIFELISKQIFADDLNVKSDIDLLLDLCVNMSEIYALTFSKENKEKLLDLI